MKSRFKKLAASVLTAAMLLQQCGMTTLAEEAQTQAETQIPTQAETPAPETQAPQTETSAPETQAPQTETSAPETQAPQTETSAPETQAPQTETSAPETQAPQTETSAPETQAPQTETEKATEKETEKKKEKETEASDRVNDGKKIEESTVTSRLGSVRTKLFAADSVILPDTLKEQVGADWILDGTDGKAAVDGLSGLSKTLANGQSTSKVEVINLYADKDGKLDTKQLEKLFKDKVIDVTDQYFVVNIIAAKKDQTLSFSGYAMKNKGQNVSYTKATQAGDILYNFATLEKGKYQAFEGTVNLSSGSGLQGTFLAPKAVVTVGSDLSGAVYAKKVTVADGVQKLLRVAYIKGAKDEAETEAVTEAATETESDTEAQTTGETEARIEQVTETQSEGLTIETEVVTEVPEQSETAAEKQTQAQVNVVLADADGNALADAGTSIFVLKDDRGAVIYNSNTKASEENEPTEAKYPLYYISGTGSQLKLSGIPTGSYYLSEVKAPDGYELADDQKFMLTDGGAEQKLTMKHKKKEGTAKVNVAVQATFTKTLLTAENDIVNYVALYSDSDLSQRVTEPKAVTFKAGDTTSSVAEFSALTDGTTYYIGLTDAFGEKAGTDYQLSDNAVAAKAAEDEQAVLDIDYTTYPDGDYSYQADISVTVQVKDVQGAAYAASDTFYAMLYQDADRTQKVLSTPLTFAMSGAAALTQSTQVKMTKASETFYLAQTDANGTEITNADPNFLYGITYPDLTNQALTVVCGQKAAATIQNQLGNSVVMLRLLDAASDKQLPGAKMVIKDTKTGKAVYSFTTGNEVETLTNKLAAGSYVLTELTAPGGYSNTKDVAFEVKDGQTTEVVMRNASYGKSAHKLTVSMQVYVGDAQVYAKDTTSGTYAKEKRYTYYAALFADKARTQKVSDVKEITVSGLSGSASFSNLEKGTYYLAETDEYGNVLSASDIHGTECKIEYSDGGKVSVSASSAQAVIKNVYSSLPKGYRHTATLTITKKLQTASGEAQTATKTFYAGIYRKKDFSDTPTVVALDLKNASEASAKRRILLSSSNEVNYYIAEVDKSGKRITDEASFGYTIQVDQPEVTLKGGEEKHVTITNKTRVSKVTLYLTKKVYEGTSKKAVNETFYAGLFKDPEFTQLYAKPIALQLKNKSEITLKLSLNLGAAAGAKIYVAEVDENGKVVQAGAKFGYDIRVVNATAEFTQEQTEVQSILLNSVYSSSSEDNWNKIISRDGNNIGGGGIGSGSNGGGGASANGSVQTGDETPILPYVGGLAAAALVIAVLLVAGRRKRQK
ncbi:MAG: SpaA isopeptide-forming pilin-related protein [Lachnospiraceae bacterium]|nr:SpaA isopeptide-forming pilin-related protein [Lachnospiraceae bacterium]